MLPLAQPDVTRPFIVSPSSHAPAQNGRVPL